MAGKTTIAVAGDAGSFSEEAGMRYAKEQGIEPELVFALDMEGALAAVQRGKAELAVFPVVNLIGGIVQSAFEAMGRHRFTFVASFPLEVNHCLMARPGVSGTDVTEVASYPQALAQCGIYLAKALPGIPTREWEDTAKAARDLAEGVLPKTAAVIAPKRSAELYGLSLLAEGIEDRKPNFTTFIVTTA